MSTLSIAPMTLAHLDAVLDIERTAAPHPWTRGIFTDELAHADSRVYRVALDGGAEVVGFGGVLLQVGEAHITNIAVHQHHRRNGIARMLMVDLMCSAVNRGMSSATLEVRAGNVAAQRLYHRFGFAPAGVRPRYYPDGEDAVIMWTDDIQSPSYAQRLAGLARHEVHE
jgi:[ribosomal protein S18]-alanine N-acetyltransferase